MTLRRLYKLVHPDLFMQAPLARTLNEISMMRLNQWLDTERTAAAQPVQLAFYIRKDTNNITTSMNNLRRVDWTIAAGAHKPTALTQLLVACGGDPTLPTAPVTAGDVDEDEQTGLALMPFLERHCVDARRLMMEAMAVDREEALLRHALSRANVAVGFPVAEWRSSKRQRIEALEKLVVLIDSLQPSHSLVGTRVVISPRAPLQPTADALGRLLFNATQSAEEWRSLLNDGVFAELKDVRRTKWMFLNTSDDFA